MKYYFLVSYVPEIHPDDKKLRLRLSDLLAEKYQFAEEDWAQIELVLLGGDVLQIDRLLSGKDVEIGYTLFGQEFWKEQIRSPKEVPEYFADVFNVLVSGGPSPKNLDLLYEAYYAYAMEQAFSTFLSAYFQFHKDLRNIMAAIRARRKGLALSDYLVGEGDLIEALSRSNAEDFGLSADFPWIERLTAVKEPVETEETIQQIVWETLDEMTEQMDFGFEVILAYLLKLQLVEKNLALSEEQGMAMVREQLEAL